MLRRTSLCAPNLPIIIWLIIDLRIQIIDGKTLKTLEIRILGVWHNQIEVIYANYRYLNYVLFYLYVYYMFYNIFIIECFVNYLYNHKP